MPPWIWPDSICGLITTPKSSTTVKRDSATAQVAGIQVDLPKASASVSLSEPKTKAVSVNNDGQVFLDAYPVTLQELEDRLRTEKATNPDFPVVLRGDAAVQYQKVVEVLDILRRLELAQVGLVTGKPKN